MKQKDETRGQRRSRMTYGIVCALVCTLAADSVARAASGSTELISATQPAGTIGLSLRNEVEAAINRSLDWLAANQQPDGSWSNRLFPALTALPLRAFIRGEHPDKERVIAGGIHYLLSRVQPDGGIYVASNGAAGGGLSTYNTAVCMTTLHEAARPDLVPVVQKAREFVARSQYLGNDVYAGGFGYDPNTGRAYTDLLNTYHAVQAMRLTQGVEDLRARGEPRVDIDWEKARAFITAMQQHPTQAAAHAGAFTNRAPDGDTETTNAVAPIVFRSYGSMTYLGMLSLIFAHVEPDDPRVLSALDWSARHWSLQENPGMGNEGLFFFYNILAKSLSVAGRDLIPRADGAALNWREDLADKLVSLQRIEPETGHGYWINASGRFWESDPVLVTAYAVLALQML